jgi:hypothetical protein
MGRPRHGVELKRVIGLSLSEEAIAHLDSLGSNRSAVVERLALEDKQFQQLELCKLMKRGVPDVDR